MKKRYGLYYIIIAVSILFCITGCDKKAVITLDRIPQYSGSPYVTIDNNIPDFQETDKTTTSFEEYKTLDILGRCQGAFANIGIDLMPTKERGSIGQVKPSGWKTIKYEMVDGKYLYNRCHLIGYQLTAENANEENLITGTRYLNIEGMLPFENMVVDYIKETKNHVLYRVTPIFEHTNLVSSGVHMEGYSVEDSGDGICFNVFVYNNQPGIVIDYKTGESCESGDTKGILLKEESTEKESIEKESIEKEVTQDLEQEETQIRGNSDSKIYHCPGQAFYEEMKDSKYLVIFHSEEEAKQARYRKAKR